MYSYWFMCWRINFLDNVSLHHLFWKLYDDSFEINLLEPQSAKVEKKERNHHTVMCEGIGSRSLKILIKHLPSLELKLLERNLLIAGGEVKRTPSWNVPTQPPEPPDCGQPATRLPCQVPQPKPPDLGD